MAGLMKPYLYNVAGQGRAFFVRADRPEQARAQVIAFYRDYMFWPLRKTRQLKRRLRVTRVPYGVFTVGGGGLRMIIDMAVLSRQELLHARYSSESYGLPLTSAQAEVLLRLVTIADLAIGEHNRTGWLPRGLRDTALKFAYGSVSLKRPLRNLAAWVKHAGVY